MKTVFVAAAFALAVLPLQAAVACEANQQAAAASTTAAQSMPAAAAQTSRVEWQYHYVGHHPHLEGHWVQVN